MVKSPDEAVVNADNVVGLPPIQFRFAMGDAPILKADWVETIVTVVKVI